MSIIITQSTGPVPHDETERLEKLRSYGVLDTPPSQELTRYVFMAAQICRAPIALISFVDKDRQWFKAVVGMAVTEMPRHHAVCSYTILSEHELIVEDLRLDPRFVANPAVTGEPFLRFYAGAPLVSPDGFRLGSLCVLDKRPRHADSVKSGVLTALAADIMRTLEALYQPHS